MVFFSCTRLFLKPTPGAVEKNKKTNKKQRKTKKNKETKRKVKQNKEKQRKTKKSENLI